MKSIFMSTVKRMPNSKNKTYPKRVRILIYKKCGLLLKLNFSILNNYVLFTLHALFCRW